MEKQRNFNMDIINENEDSDGILVFTLRTDAQNHIRDA